MKDELLIKQLTEKVDWMKEKEQQRQNALIAQEADEWSWLDSPTESLANATAWKGKGKKGKGKGMSIMMGWKWMKFSKK